MSDKKWTLSPSGQKVLKPIHSLFAKIFGIGLIVLLVLMIGRLGDEGVSRQAGDPALYYVLWYAVNLGLVGVVVTGLVYALCTPWGFFRHRWIVVKWAGLAAILAVLIFGLAPAVGEMTVTTDAGLHPGLFAGEYRSAARQGVVYCVVEIVLVIALSLVSVFKPGGESKKQ
ncbi:MAG: hypothetical protein JW885_05630 [Deltaproteobacteria bacterium]|nr:hypothetical protein [Candidatus Zymogenaceae bacterium]